MRDSVKGVTLKTEPKADINHSKNMPFENLPNVFIENDLKYHRYKYTGKKNCQ